MLWCMDSALALKYHSYGLESWLAVHLEKGSALRERQCTLEGEAWYVNVQGNVHWEGVYSIGEVHTGLQIFLIDY